MSAEKHRAAPTLDAETIEPQSEAAELPPRISSLLEAAPATQPAPVPPAAPFPALGLAKVLQVQGDEAHVDVGGTMMTVPIGLVHPSVLRTASERGEPVLVERAPDGKIRLVGALRTQPTPGVDAMDEVSIEADRIHLRGKQEVTLESSTTARIALRAAGEIETYASRILSKAEEVHKIVGRMLRLN